MSHRSLRGRERGLGIFLLCQLANQHGGFLLLPLLGGGWSRREGGVCSGCGLGDGWFGYMYFLVDPVTDSLPLLPDEEGESHSIDTHNHSLAYLMESSFPAYRGEGERDEERERGRMREGERVCGVYYSPQPLWISLPVQSSCSFL